jgi:exonuclease III
VRPLFHLGKLFVTATTWGNLPNQMRILIWNVRGLGDDDKNETVHKTLDEAKTDLICLQETKLIDISLFKARNFLPASFTEFVY